MKRKQLAVCDREPEYTFRFAEYANQRKDSLFAVHGFTSCEELKEYAKEHPLDILLLSEEYSGEITEREEYGQIFCLSEQEYQGEEQKYPAVYKFQSCPQILSRVLDLYAEQTPMELGYALRTENMKCIGVYSPIARTGKTGFALALGKELGKQKKTLYLNLEEYSGFTQLYPYGDGGTLSELMYFLKQGKHAFACKLEGMIQHMGGLDYVPPLKSPVELRHISLGDWEQLLEALGRESHYEIAILDLGGVVNGLYELLERCDWIYMPICMDEVARAKLSQYEDTLALLEMEEVRERTKHFQMSSEEETQAFARAEGRRWAAD